MKMNELHKLAKNYDLPMYPDGNKSFKYPHYLVRAFYDRHEKKRYMGIWRNGADNITDYFNVDNLNSEEITSLINEKIAALHAFDEKQRRIFEERNKKH